MILPGTLSNQYASKKEEKPSFDEHTLSIHCNNCVDSQMEMWVWGFVPTNQFGQAILF